MSSGSPLLISLGPVGPSEANVQNDWPSLIFLVLPRSLVVPASRHKAPQSGLWLLLSSSGRHSEEPRVVVTRATQTAQNSTGHKSTGIVGLFLVTRCNFSAKQGHNLEFHGFMQRRVLGILVALYHSVV